MNPFKKKLKPTTPYMPAVRAAIDAKDFVKAVDIIPDCGRCVLRPDRRGRGDNPRAGHRPGH